MTNNFKQIGEYIDSLNCDNDTFFHISIISRLKDNRKQLLDKVIYDTYITSSREIYNQETTITKVCESLNARAYISLIPLSMQKYTDNLKHLYYNKSPQNLRQSIKNAMIKSNKNDDVLLLVDIDAHQLEDMDGIRELLKDNIIIEVPSRTGLHFVCNKFNVTEFHRHYPSIVVKTNGMTILYAY